MTTTHWPPNQADVDALRDLLDSMAEFSSNDQRARYLLSSNWMRDRGAAASAHHVRTPVGSGDVADQIAALERLQSQLAELADMPDRYTDFFDLGTLRLVADLADAKADAS